MLDRDQETSALAAGNEGSVPISSLRRSSLPARRAISPDQPRALRELRRVAREHGRVAISVYSAIERTPGAGAGRFADQGKHSFTDPMQLETLLRHSGFNAVHIKAVEQMIAPFVLDYVRFQLLATPMTALVEERTEANARRSSHRSRLRS